MSGGGVSVNWHDISQKSEVEVEPYTSLSAFFFNIIRFLWKNTGWYLVASVVVVFSPKTIM